MPRVKRYFHCSQELIADPEVWELITTFGDRSILTWLQILIYLERTDNCWKLDGDWLAILSRTVRQSQSNLKRQLEWMVTKGWLTAGGPSADPSRMVGGPTADPSPTDGQPTANPWPTVLKGSNWLKYNKTRYIEPFTIDIPSVPYRSVPYQKKDKEGSTRQASVKPTDDGQDVKSTKKKAAAKRQALDEFAITDELRQWARTEFSVEIPDDVLTEFKDYWRKEPDRKLRLDWGATFKNNIRKLVGWKILKPVVAAPTPVKFTGHKKVVL